MKTNPIAKSRASLALVTLLLLCFFIPSLRAEVFGLFTYQVVGGATIEITDYPDTATGPVVIPAVIDGKPVTSIGDRAFYYCAGLTSITIPSSVTNIGGSAFSSCTDLTSVTIPSSVTSFGGYYSWEDGAPFDGVFDACTGLTNVTLQQGLTTIGPGMFSSCTALTNVTIPSSVTTIGEWAFYYCTGLTSVTLQQGLTTIGEGMFASCNALTSVTIPNSVTTIGDRAFYYCAGLTSVTIPTSVTYIGRAVFYHCSGLTSITIPSSVRYIGDYAFEGTGLTSVTIPSSVNWIGSWAFGYCSGLTRAVFLGNAPSLGFRGFIDSAPGFTIYYLSGSTGFTSQPGTWNGYPATMINQATWPAASWLLTHGFWYDTDLQQDPNGDGVSLLMAYALNLDPRLNLPGSLPQPVLGAGTLSMDFHATSPGITYTVQTSTDLQTWTTQGVVLSAPGPDGRATATVLRDSPSRFLRLVVAR